MTCAGTVLRSTYLDELPQFLNVIKGDMKLVGPRPEMPHIVQCYTPLQRRRLRVRPGITGLWQLSDCRTSPIHENIKYDLYYIRHRSLWLDLRILAATFCFLLDPKRIRGSYREESRSSLLTGGETRPHTRF